MNSLASKRGEWNCSDMNTQTYSIGRCSNGFLVMGAGNVASSDFCHSELEAYAKIAELAARAAGAFALEVKARGGDLKPGATMAQLEELRRRS